MKKVSFCHYQLFTALTLILDEEMHGFLNDDMTVDEAPTSPRARRNLSDDESDSSEDLERYVADLRTRHAKSRVQHQLSGGDGVQQQDAAMYCFAVLVSHDIAQHRDPS